jgi:hypothetical protein
MFPAAGQIRTGLINSFGKGTVSTVCRYRPIKTRASAPEGLTHYLEIGFMRPVLLSSLI